ncbi:hypothetical protein A4G99_14725 [Haladaptatus sp. R4]|uniref:hypothetical protein n=1 Tax=Haladaptatus sp. R4 TaxID=1679489 RepID=UPI0007B4D8EC|nr:hypothetical protein [Haladaptatus sp. R4]KZN23289.1 hypothetical protein A4G99_14725 [Haladaptatus sp. R4]
MSRNSSDTAVRSGGRRDWWGYYRAAVLVLVGLIPWEIVTWPKGYYVIFMFGSTKVGLSGFNFFSIPPLTPYTPDFMVMRLVAVVCYLLALLTAALGYLGYGDRRITAGLLFISGLEMLRFTLALNDQNQITVYPIGVVTLWIAVLFAYSGRRFRSAVTRTFSGT